MIQDSCPVCGAGLTIIGSNTEGWIALCTFGHQTVLTDNQLTLVFADG